MTKRFERTERQGIRLTERDQRTLEAVFETRYLTNRLIARLFYTPTTFSYCKQRLRYLFDLGYLRKRKAYPNEPDIYYLGLKGRRYIASLGGHSAEIVDRVAGVSGEGDAAPMLMMNHELTLSDLYVNARLTCQDYGWTMAWKNTRLLELEQLGIQPDAWIEVINGPHCKSAFLEFTGVLPDRRELAGKVARYEAYWEQHRQATPVLWLTTSRHKLTGLMEGVRRSIYKDYFLGGLIEDAGHFLTARMWHWSEAEGMIPWLKPPETS